MGTQYYVACRNCGVRRDLDKFGTMSNEVGDRPEALSRATDVANDAFRAGLLASFMWKHRGHDCTVFTEHDDMMHGEFEPECVDFWDGQHDANDSECEVDASFLVASGWDYDAMSFTASTEVRGGRARVMRSPSRTFIRLADSTLIDLPHVTTVGQFRALCDTFGI